MTTTRTPSCLTQYLAQTSAIIQKKGPPFGETVGQRRCVGMLLGQIDRYINVIKEEQ